MDVDTGPITIVTGADENYAVGLAVTVRSTLDHLSPGRHIELYVLDGGIEPATKNSLLQSWKQPNLTVHWQKADMDSLSHLVTAGHLNHTTYLRLLIPSILPESTHKAIYLDSDLLIRRDIGLLWDEPMHQNSALAGQETGAPYVDAEMVWNGQSLKYSKVGITTPIRNYRALGMNPLNKVFNAGVLVINVDYWRREKVPAMAYECLEKNRDYVLFCDQYALNVVLADSWREIDTRWNQTAHFYNYSSVADSPFDESTYGKLKNDPWICHFTWKYKPWMEGCNHPFQAEYFASMQRTHYAGQPLAPHPDTIVTQEVISSSAIPVIRQPRTWSQWWSKRRMKLAKRLASVTGKSSRAA